MGKIEYIKKSRKEQKCGKCGNIIPVGNPYRKGILFKMPPIIRCDKCGLKSYEVTTSDYIMTVGRIVEDWAEDYGVGECTAEAISEALQEVLDTCQDNLDNIPEQLQDGSAGQLLQERIDELEIAIDELDSFVWNEMLENGYNNLDADEQEIIDAEQERRNGAEFEDWFSDYLESGSVTAVSWSEQVDEEIDSFINNALSDLNY